MKKFLALPGLLFLFILVASCGRRPLQPQEWHRNQIFAEILHREDIRALGADSFFPDHLRGSDPELQRWCAVALGRIGNPRALPWLCDSLRSTYAAVREASAFAIGETEDRDLRQSEGRNADPRAHAALEAALGDPALMVRARAMEALGKAGERADALEIARRLRAFAYDGSPGHRMFLNCALTALMRLKNNAVLPALIDVAAIDDPEMQWRVANVFYRLRYAKARPVIERLLESPNSDVQAHAARALGICGDPSLEFRLIPLIMPAKDGRPVPLPVRVSALQALVGLKAPHASAAIHRALTAALPGSAEPARLDQLNFSMQAVTALGTIGSEEDADVLAGFARDYGPATDNAVIALAKVLRKSPDRFFALFPASPARLPCGARAWASAMGELGGVRAQDELKRMLLEAARDASGQLRIPSVLQALARAQTPGLNTILTAFLASDDEYIVRSALDAYQPESGTPAPWKPLLQVYGRIPGGNCQETKTAVIRKLEPWLAAGEIQAFLETVSKDPERNVRIAASRLLRQAGKTAGFGDPGPSATQATAQTYTQAAASRRERTIAVIETDRGTIEIELYRQDAPLTVDNFVTLAKGTLQGGRGFFDGLSFMRVVPFFVIQGGDPRNDQEGGPGYSIRCEINMHPFERGSVGMALSGKDTGGSQFFITLSPQPHLDGGYTCFGRVISGMSVAEHIVAGDRIRSVRIKEEKTFLDFRRY